jgi:hypothetical protein
MKHIKVYEKFDSDVISRTLGFLKRNNISEDNYDKFIRDIKLMCSQQDIPMSKITDDIAQYVNYNKAISIKAPKDFNNDIYAVKFWFSTNDGYLMKSAIGNKTIPYTKSVPNFDRIKAWVKHGIIKPIKNGNIKHLDKIIVAISGRVCVATAFSDGRSMYAIQNYINGSSPEYNDTWRAYGTCSWWLFYHNTPEASDGVVHGLYIDSDKELSIYGQDDFLDYNLNTNFKTLLPWDDSDNSEDLIKKSEFAIIIYISKLKNISASNIKRERSVRKYEIDHKKDNLERYINTIIDSIGINTDKINLRKIIRIFTYGNYCIPLIEAYGSHILHTIYNDIIALQDNQHTIYDVISQFKYFYNNTYLDGVEKLQIYNSKFDPMIISKVSEINSYISKYFSNIELEDIDDIEIVSLRFVSLGNLLNNKRINNSKYINHSWTMKTSNKYDVPLLDTDDELKELNILFTKIKKIL